MNDQFINLHSILYVLTFYIFYMVYAYLDGVRDGIDHYKGAETLYVYWHLIKHFSRFALVAGTWAGAKSDSLLVLFIFPALPVLKLVWDEAYMHRSTWARIDNNFYFQFGIWWLDKMLGFDKQPGEPIQFESSGVADHQLPCYPSNFSDVMNGFLTVAFLDYATTQIKVGDIVCFNEIEIVSREGVSFTGRKCTVKIMYIMTDEYEGVGEGYYAINFKKI